MQTADAVIRLQNLNGVWETCGIDRLRGVVPHDIRLEANKWGADTASFTLKRDPSALWPDLLAFTPVEVEVGGVLVWDGYISQTPTTDNDGGSVSVQCKGWQYHLDDDSFEKLWVSTAFSDWKDARDFQAASLNYYRPGYSVSASDGVLSLSFPKGAALKQNTYAAVIFDAGPDNKVAAISATWKVESGADMGGSTGTGIRVYAKSLDTIPGLDTNFTAAANALGTSGTVLGATGATTKAGGTFSTPGRYVMLGIRWQNADDTAALNYTAKFTSISVASNSSYYNGTTKAITGPLASSIIAEALPKAPLLNQSTDGISTTSFNIPHLSSIEGGRSPREYIDAVNSYHDYVTKVIPGKQLIFKPKPSAPTVAIGNWGGSQFEDASANSADEIYNKVIVEGTGGDGLPLRVTRNSGNLTFKSIPPNYVDQALLNGTFAGTVGATPSNWAASGATSSIAVASADAITGNSGKWTLTTYSSTVDYRLTCTPSSGFTFVDDTTYTLTFNMRTFRSGWDTLVVTPQIEFGEWSGSAFTTNSVVALNTYTEIPGTNPTYSVSVSWTPSSNATSDNTRIRLSVGDGYYDDSVLTSGTYFIVDDFNISYSKPTLPDKRGFYRTKRLQVESILTPASAVAIGDTYLASRLTTPLKGSVEISGSGARDYLSGAAIHPSQLLLEVGERIHLSHRADPDTGASGRDGDIAGVSYDHSTQKAQLSIDSQRNRFESLLARLAVVTNSATGR